MLPIIKIKDPSKASSKHSMPEPSDIFSAFTHSRKRTESFHESSTFSIPEETMVKKDLSVIPEKPEEVELTDS